VDAFNMGAMENKGLNIFNTSYVLADPKTATDTDFLAVQGVVAHEYFHNWTGNRVTCRDWFQLTLKEGLTVFRDQEFSCDMYSRPVTRIHNVVLLRTRQFPEDAGPNAHPIRPTSYIEINNFYTPTVYEKGSEVIRMVHTLIGKKNFRKGMEKYFELYDGKAITTDDFLNSMAQVSQKDFSQFQNWYHQAGTPVVKVQGQYDKIKKEYILRIEQSCPATPGQDHKTPFFFPFQVGLIDESGKEVLNKTLEISKSEEYFIFDNIESSVLPSLNRNFTAPVKVIYSYTRSDLLHLLAYDNDEFNRFDSAQMLMIDIIKDLVNGAQVVPEDFLEAMGIVIGHPNLENTLKALILKIPTVSILVDEFSPPDFTKIYEARNKLKRNMAQSHEKILLSIYEDLNKKDYSQDDDFYSKEAIGQRALKNLCLSYLCSLEKTSYIELTYKHFKDAKNMTDEISALNLLASVECPERHMASREFKDKWKDETLVVNKWFTAEAISELPVIDRIKELMKNPLFDLKIPNKVRALIGNFANHNLPQFHDLSGAGYELLANTILEIDSFNPRVASGLCGCFNRYAILDNQRATLMKKELEKILSRENISTDVFEIISKTLSSRR